MIIEAYTTSSVKTKDGNLFLIQDADRSMFVIASDFQSALKSWTERIAKENNCIPEDVDPPVGIQFVANSDELIR